MTWDMANHLKSLLAYDLLLNVHHEINHDFLILISIYDFAVHRKIQNKFHGRKKNVEAHYMTLNICLGKNFAFGHAFHCSMRSDWLSLRK